eukprot:5545698-Amphidinium_carterae.1
MPLFTVSTTSARKQGNRAFHLRCHFESKVGSGTISHIVCWGGLVRMALAIWVNQDRAGSLGLQFVSFPFRFIVPDAAGWGAGSLCG